MFEFKDCIMQMTSVVDNSRFKITTFVRSNVIKIVVAPYDGEATFIKARAQFFLWLLLFGFAS